jgi:hypothetical protein
MLRDISSICCPRHVYMICKSMCFYQQSLHGLQDSVILVDMSGGLKDPLHSQACLHGLQEPVLLLDMSVQSTEPVLRPDMSAWSAEGCAAPRHVCMVYREHVLQTGHVCMIYRSMCCSQTCLHGCRSIL